MKLLQNISTLLKGRWQIPLAVVAAATAGYAVYRLQPAPPALDFRAVEAEIAALGHAEKWADAIDAAANVLAVHPELTAPQQAALHRRIAELLQSQEAARPTPLKPNLELILTHEDAARQAGAPVAAVDELRVAQAHDGLGNALPAAEQYRKVLACAEAAAEARAARQALVRLLDGRPEYAAERREHLLTALAEPNIAPEYVWWGLQEALVDVLDEGDTIAARLLLERYGGGLSTSDLKGYLEYLTALVMVHEGRTAEATPVVDWIDEWLARQPLPTGPIEAAGYLPAMNRWLMGRICLAEERPQEALVAFDEALKRQPDEALRVAALAGRGAALSLLERHEPALAALREVAAALQPRRAQRGRVTDRVVRDLRGLFEAVRDRGDRRHALEYLKLAAGLADENDVNAWIELRAQLGAALAEAAEHEPGETAQRELQAAAGAAYEQAAEKSLLDDGRYGDLLWLSATSYDAAGRLSEARHMLQRFAETRSTDRRLPAALLRLGQVCDAAGRLDDALRWYGEVLGTYPELQEAALARLHAAECHAALGGAHDADAERLLRELVESGDLAPQAVVFRDALQRLAELYYEQERFADAVSRLEDFRRLYPDDPERYVATFQLADAYRRSALALQAGEHSPAQTREVQTRFRRAAELFAALASESAPASLPPDQAATYQRLALFNEADCLYALNDPATLPEALAIYREAGTRYEREPAALTAQIQMANIHLRLGQNVEAARAVERARWLLRNIPDAAFASGDAARDRTAWEKYLATISNTPLFQGVLAAAP